MLFGVSMPKYKAGLHKIKVNTWGTRDQAGNGVSNYLQSELQGTNVGHASIEMTLPVNKETTKWIETYCIEETYENYKKNFSKNPLCSFNEYLNSAPKRIPVRLIQHSTPLALHNNKGELQKTDKIASETSYYKIDFSFWPGQGIPFALSNMEMDMIDERSGRSFEYTDRAKDYLHPEERVHKKLIGKTKMTYAPLSIAHQRSLKDSRFAEIELAIKLTKVREALNTSELLSYKINKLKSTKINGSLASLCYNIGLSKHTILEEFKKTTPLNKKTTDVEAFIVFFKTKAKEHYARLRELEKELTKCIPNIGSILNQKDYITFGIRPDHSIDLPYATKSDRGFNPEAMLKKMRELTEPEAEEFDLYSKNCSKTTIAILKAGAAHDSLLKRTVGEEALGFMGTPQQVIGNAQRAEHVLAINQSNNVFKRMAQAISNSFKEVLQWFKKDTPSVDLETQITSPLPSSNNALNNAMSYDVMAKLVNKQVAKNIAERTIEIIHQKISPLTLLKQFEKNLKDNPTKVITLSDKDFKTLNTYVLKKKDSELIARFQYCCDESLSRANRLSPHKPSEVDEVIEQHYTEEAHRSPGFR